MLSNRSIVELARYLDAHFQRGAHLVIGSNSTEPRSHTRLKELACNGPHRSTVCRIIRKLIRQAEASGLYLLFNSIDRAVPEQEKLKKNTRNVLYALTLKDRVV